MLTGEQIQAGRALARIRQPELATAAGVSLETIKRLEGMRGMVAAQVATVIAIKRALETAGVIFIEENGGGAGVRLKKVPPV